MNREDLEFLVDLQDRMNKQDETSASCDFQASPYFWGVAENKIQWGVDPDYCTDEVCFYYDSESYYSIEECKELFKDLLDDDSNEIQLNEIVDISSWSDVEDYKNRYDIYGDIVYGRKVEDIISKFTGCFLTKQACKEHIEKNGYHYSEPHTYAMTADRNPEFERVWNILKKTDWKQLADLEAKLDEKTRIAEGYSELFDKRQHENYEQFCEIQELKAKLAESEKALEDKNKLIIQEDGECLLCGDGYCINNDVAKIIEENKKLKKQLELLDYEKSIKHYSLNRDLANPESEEMQKHLNRYVFKDKFRIYCSMCGKTHEYEFKDIKYSDLFNDIYISCKSCPKSLNKLNFPEQAIAFYRTRYDLVCYEKHQDYLSHRNHISAFEEEINQLKQQLIEECKEHQEFCKVADEKVKSLEKEVEKLDLMLDKLISEIHENNFSGLNITHFKNIVKNDLEIYAIGQQAKSLKGEK